MKIQLKTALLASLFSLMSLSLLAQNNDVNPIITSMPSLTIAPDARAGGMGDAGVATAPDIYSQHWNAAKYAFAPSQAGFGISYTPWLRKIVNDVNMVYGSGYYKLGGGDNQAISASIKYFSIGDITGTDSFGNYHTQFSPYELAIDVGYSRKLTETFSGAVTIRYLRADYAGDKDGEGSAGNTVAADLAGYNESYVRLGNMESLLSFGFNISNIGGKMKNGGVSSFIPANLRLGTSIMLPVTDESTLSFSLDLNKLLVPTPPKFKDEMTPEEWEKKKQDYYDMSSFKGIFKSFGDASFSEEMKEIAISFGAEYDYSRKFKVRTGYFHENKMKGNRRYVTFGAGLHLSAFQLDVAYLLSTAHSNPLDQTLRFTLGFDIEGIQKLFK